MCNVLCKLTYRGEVGGSLLLCSYLGAVTAVVALGAFGGAHPAVVAGRTRARARHVVYGAAVPTAAPVPAVGAEPIPTARRTTSIDRTVN